MNLTDKQKNNIAKLPIDTQIEILHEIAENLGIVSVSEYCKIMGMKKRNCYYKLSENKIKNIDFCDTTFLIINEK